MQARIVRENLRWIFSFLLCLLCIPCDRPHGIFLTRSQYSANESCHCAISSSCFWIIKIGRGCRSETAIRGATPRFLCYWISLLFPLCGRSLTTHLKLTPEKIDAPFSRGHALPALLSGTGVETLWLLNQDIFLVFRKFKIQFCKLSKTCFCGYVISNSRIFF